MTRRCQLCGAFDSVNTSIHPSVDVCFGCLTNLIDEEVDRRALRRELDDLASALRVRVNTLPDLPPRSSEIP